VKGGEKYMGIIDLINTAQGELIILAGIAYMVLKNYKK